MYKFSEKTPQPLDQCSDETLCQLVAGGSREAEEALVTRYNRLVRTCARPFFLVGGDSEDLTQEGMVGLLKAVREYDASKEASFRTFAEICIRNRLYSGSREAEEALVTRYNRLVRTCARPFFLVGGDSEDLTQEGMVGLLKAVREYDASKEASFRTFAEICIRNRLYSVLRAAARDKHMALNQSVPLDTPFFDANSYTSGTSDLTQRDPEAYLIDREHTAALLSGVRKQLSEFEAKILGYYLDGLSCREIAETVGKPPKSVDNAVQRIRRKVARQLLSGDLSGS